MLNVYSVPTEKTSPLFAAAFAQGCGGMVRTGYVGGAWAGFGSPANWWELQNSIADGDEFYYGDHGYFQRGKYYRITKNAYFHDGRGITDYKRIKTFIDKPRDWQKGGKYIVVCPQSDGFFKMRGMTQSGWLDKTVNDLLFHSDRQMKIHYKRDAEPLESLLKDAHAVVSYSSNAALVALMNGVPAFNTGDSHARHVTLSDLTKIEKPFYPENRYEWAAVLADNQWTLDEMKSGMAWRHLNGNA